MTQADRDRLVTLKKARKKLITQGEAGEELGVSIRQVQRLLYGLKERGDKAVIHGLRGKPSNRRIEESIEQQAVKILSTPVYEGFGPTLAAACIQPSARPNCWSGPKTFKKRTKSWTGAGQARCAERRTGYYLSIADRSNVALSIARLFSLVPSGSRNGKPHENSGTDPTSTNATEVL